MARMLDTSFNLWELLGQFENLEHTIMVLGRGHPVVFNLLTPTGYAMHQQFNIQQLYALPTLYLCVLYLSENKQRLVPLTA